MSTVEYSPKETNIEEYEAGQDANAERYWLGDMLHCVIIPFGLFGQQAVILTAAGLQLNSRSLTIPSRAFMVLLALTTFAVLLMRVNRINLRWYLVAFAIFWATYVSRILLEAGTRVDVVVETGRYTIGFLSSMAIGACFLPGLAILLNSCWSWHSRMRTYTMLLASLSGVAMLVFYGEQLMHFENRMRAGETVGEVSTINSLTLGYLGAVLVVLSLYSFACLRSGLFWRSVIGVGLGGMGLFLLVGSASRGPMVSAAFTGIVLMVSQSRRFDLNRMLLLVFALGASVFGLIYIVNQTGSAALNRLMNTGDSISEKGESASRLELYSIAFGKFAESPIVGSSLTLRAEDGTDMYPHNVILESLLATGLLGTIPFLFLVISAVTAAWRILTRYPDHGWIAVIFILFLAGSMFSGAIFSNAQMWLSMAATLSCDSWLKRTAQYSKDYDSLK